MSSGLEEDYEQKRIENINAQNLFMKSLRQKRSEVTVNKSEKKNPNKQATPVTTIFQYLVENSESRSDNGNWYFISHNEKLLNPAHLFLEAKMAAYSAFPHKQHARL